MTAALEEYIRYRRQLRILKTAGGFDLDPAYDYKADRRRRQAAIFTIDRDFQRYPSCLRLGLHDPAGDA